MKKFISILIVYFIVSGFGLQAQVITTNQPTDKYLGKLSNDPIKCNPSTPTRYFNTTTNRYRFCSGINQWGYFDSITDGTKGDVTVSSGGSVINLNNSVVTTNKLLDGSVTNIKLAGGIAQSKITNLTADLARIGSVSGSFTKASLPTTAVDGQLARVTDSSRGIWRFDTATQQWIPLHQVYNVQDFGAKGSDGTSDKAAIQSAINAAFADGGGDIYFPDGVYDDACLSLPSVGINPTKLITMTFSGTYQPASFFGTLADGNEVVTQKGAILKCSSTTQPALKVQPGAAFQNFSLYLLVVRNLTFRSYQNPQQPAIDAAKASQLIVENVGIDTGTFNVLASEPTNDISALITPTINNGALTNLSNVMISGYFNCLEANEHTSADNLYLYSCKNALYLRGGYHAMNFNRVEVGANKRNIRIPNETFPAYFNIKQFDVEHKTLEQSNQSTQWQITDYDVFDPGNRGYGTIEYHAVTGGIGVEQIFTKSGGANVNVRAITDPVISPVATRGDKVATTAITHNVMTALSFDNVQSGTGINYNAASPTQLIVTQAGFYDVVGTAHFSVNATGVRLLYISKNGQSLLSDSKTGNSVVLSDLSINGQVYLSVGDVIQLIVFQSSGADLSLSNANCLLTAQIVLRRVS